MPRKYFSLTVLISAFCFTSYSHDYKRVDSTALKNNCKIIHFLEEEVPWDIYVIQVDLTNKNTRFKTGLANDKIAWTDGAGNTFSNKETVGSMISRRIEAGEDIIAGINSDFFNMANGMQFNVTATNGEIASTGITPMPHAAFYTGNSGEPFINMVNYTQHVVIPGAGEYNVNGVNIIRAADYLVIYNQFAGQNESFANEWGIELLLEPQDSGLINGVRNYKVIDKSAKVSLTNSKQLILSGHGKANSFLSNAETGSYIQIYTTFSGLKQENITEMIGGWGHIVSDGKNRAAESIEEEGTMEHENDRHPRSAVGFNADKTWLYLVAVDGRSDISKGMNLSELANFMIEELNISEGLNFDGGGSTTLMAGNQTVNNPSGGVQRAIANALLIVNDTTLTAISEDYLFETNPTTSLPYNGQLYLEKDETNKAVVWVVETDLNEEGIQLKPLFANDKIGWIDAFNIAHKNSKELSLIAISQADTNYEFLTGINASPFHTKSGAISGTVAANGILASFLNSENATPAIWLDNNIPHIGNLNVDIKIKASNGNEMVVNSVNGVRWIDNLVIYNSFIGERSTTNQWGAEILCQPKGEMFINGTITCDVLQKEASQASGTGKMPFSGSQFVLSGNSDAYNFINDNIAIGQEIEFITNTNLPSNVKLKHIIAGTCQLIKEGNDFSSEAGSLPGSNLVLGYDLRTAVGYNQDKSKLFFFVSDKYSDENKGLPTAGLVSLMKKYQVYDGICMDGGAHTSLYTNNSLINTEAENEPEIANALAIMFGNPTGISTINKAIDIFVYPNPANDQIFIQTSQEFKTNIHFELYNNLGKNILTNSIQSKKSSVQIPLSNVEEGLYHFRIISDGNELKTGNIIIQH